MRVHTAQSTNSRRHIRGRNTNQCAQMLIIGLRDLTNSPHSIQTFSISNKKRIIRQASRKWSNHSVSKNSRLGQQTPRVPRQFKWRRSVTSRLYLTPLGRLCRNLSEVLRLARACRKLLFLASKVHGLCECKMSENWQS